MKDYYGKFSLTACCLLLTVALVCTEGPARAQSTTKVAGLVLDKETKEPVPYVHIYTKAFSAATTSDEKGKFEIVIAPSDTIVFSAIGFHTYLFSLNQKEIRSYYEVVIELDFKTYELEPVKVTAYKDLDQFKKEILDLNIPSKEKEFSVSIPKGARVEDNHPSLNNNTMGGGVTIQGPITAIYNAFSKEGKEKRRLEAYRKESSEQKVIHSKYNIEIVKRITNLNEEGAIRFMEWCRFDDEFVLQSTEYEITVAMLKCLGEFSKNDSIN